MVASAIVVGAALSAWASTYGVKMQLDNFAKSLFYYLFMYGVGLRVGPSFINSLKGDGLKFTVLALICSVMGLLGAVFFTKLWDLPAGAAGGMFGTRGAPGPVGTPRFMGPMGAAGAPGPLGPLGPIAGRPPGEVGVELTRRWGADSWGSSSGCWGRAGT